MPSDWRRTRRTDNFLMATVVAPASFLSIVMGLVLLFGGVWWSAFGLLIVGTVLGTAVVRQARRTRRTED